MQMQHVLSQEFLRQTVFEETDADLCSLQGFFSTPATGSPSHSQRTPAPAPAANAATSSCVHTQAPLNHDSEANSCEPPMRRHCSEIPPFCPEAAMQLKSFGSLPWGAIQHPGGMQKWSSTSRGTSPSPADAGGDTAMREAPKAPHAGSTDATYSHAEEVRRVMDSAPSMPPPAPLRPKVTDGMTQEDVYAFIISVYEASGLQRQLRREDHKVWIRARTPSTPRVLSFVVSQAACLC